MNNGIEMRARWILGDYGTTGASTFKYSDAVLWYDWLPEPAAICDDCGEDLDADYRCEECDKPPRYPYKAEAEK